MRGFSRLRGPNASGRQSMSFAGFAGLMNTLRRRGDGWVPMDLYQLRIVYVVARIDR